MGSCTSQLGDAQCCLDSHCPGGDATCVNAALATGGACGTVWTSFSACVNTTLDGLAAGACVDHISICTP